MGRNRRLGGTTLVITLALLAALAIIGTTMISMARMDRFAARSYRYNTQMDLAADAALEWFGARWSENYWNREVPYYPTPGPTAPTAKPYALLPQWNSYNVCLPGDGSALSSRGDSPYDSDTLISLLGVGGAPPTVSQIARVNTANPCYKINTAVQTTNVPTAAWPIPNAGVDGYIYPELRFPVGPNRTVEVSLTAVDLCGRINVNFTGSFIPPSGGALSNAVCTSSRGDSIQQVTPANTVILPVDLPHIIAGNGFGIGRYGPTTPPSTMSAFTSELVDGTMNPFAPGLYAGLVGTATLPGLASPATRPLPYNLEDLSELLNIYGAQNATGLGVFKSRLQTQASGGSLGPATAKASARTMVTTHSWTSAVRRYYNNAPTLAAAAPNETVGALHVKADLNNAPQADLEQALLATRMFKLNTSDMNVMEQIVANIMDYRRECIPSATVVKPASHACPLTAYIGHPTALAPVTTGVTLTAGTNIYGVQRQPYINEVYIKLQDTPGTPTGITSKGNKGYKYNVFIQLANPYNQPLYFSQEFTDLWVGDDGSDPYGNLDVTKCTTLGTLPPNTAGNGIPAATAPGLAGGCVVGAIVVSDSRNSWTNLKYQLQPIRLFNTAINPATGTGPPILIDRMTVAVIPSFTSSQQFVGNTQSIQRPTYIGTSHTGASLHFFGGYMESPPTGSTWGPNTYYDVVGAESTAMTASPPITPSGYVLRNVVSNALGGSPKAIRPIENRSRTWYNNITPVRTRAYYPPWGQTPSATNPELSFACPGDLCRLLIIGPGFGYQTSATGGGTWSAGGTLGYIVASQSTAAQAATGQIWTVTEQLGATIGGGAAPDECDMHIDLAKISTKTSPASGASPTTYGIGGVPYDWRRLIDVFNVNSPYYDGLDNSGFGLMVDNQPTGAALSGSTTAVIGELYEHGRINLLTAPSQVIQGLVAPLMGMVSSTNPTMTTLTTAATYNQYRQYPVNAAGGPWRSPADILDINNKWAQGLFVGQANPCDDDGNGAYNDYAKKCWLYTFISNWATIRSDSVAVYGTVRLMDTTVSSTVPQGLRHFVAVMDRVPATAYQPLLYKSAAVPTIPNPNYQPPRRLLLTWLD